MTRNPTSEEIRLWKAQLKGVKPLSKTAKKPQIIEEQKPVKKVSPQRPILKKSTIVPPTLSPQSISRKELRHFKVEARLDLHGMSFERGYEALEQFLRQTQDRGFKTVLIITGKGSISSEHTLRHQLPQWMKERPIARFIASFHHPAKPRDGGQGAFYVIIRKK